MPTATTTGSLGATCLAGEWWLTSTRPDAATSPADLTAANASWVAIPRPMPVGQALDLAAPGPADLRIDGHDWWYRCRFRTDGAETIRFDGLATLADVWLAGEKVHSSEQMFVPQRVALRGGGDGAQELHLRFASVDHWLARKRARPAWKTRLVNHQQLRWLRTSLLGRIPSWCPEIPIVGPWRPIWLEPRSPLTVGSTRIASTVDGTNGKVTVELAVTSPAEPSGTARIGAFATPFAVEATGSSWLLNAVVLVPDVELWWPHTHGAQPRYPASASITVDGAPVEISFGRIGFRTLEVDRGDDGHGFGLRINGTPVFARGSCWTPPRLSHGATTEGLTAVLEQTRAAGMNMIRIGGTMAYESEAFYDGCDDLGILVWQDLMFANMDYPVADAGFAALVRQEAEALFERFQGRPSVAVICGGSEVEQQAAMLGLGPDRWTNPWFDEELPALSALHLPGAAYVRASPTGGVLPFHVDRGISHYYGVGAYRRPLTDARLANVRFAAECLAFSHVPEPAGVEALLATGEQAPHHPKWKAGVPRDPGAGWDFEDVREHYVEIMFRISSAELRDLRATDPERYLELGRVTTGEVVARTISEWRRPGSSCRGALAWFYRDFQPGAGWGLVDHGGNPKPAYWYFERAARPIGLLLSDEGLNGLVVHVVNDTPEPFRAQLRVTAYRAGRVAVGSDSRAVTVGGRSTGTWSAESILGGFRDLTYAYRFGPPDLDVVAVTLLADDGRAIATECFWPLGLPRGRSNDLGMTATVHEDGMGLTIEAGAVATGVALRLQGATPAMNYLSLEPGTPLTIGWRRAAADRPVTGHVVALNWTGALRIGP